jgi:phage/plasmid-associated DNA primase
VLAHDPVGAQALDQQRATACACLAAAGGVDRRPRRTTDQRAKAGTLAAAQPDLAKEGLTNVRVAEAKGRLRGNRFILASETSNSARLDEALIKELTGGDTLTGAKLHGDSFDFSPTHTIWLACNHLPAIKDETVAMWSRVKVIPFRKIFTDGEQNKCLSCT